MLKPLRFFTVTCLLLVMSSCAYNNFQKHGHFKKKSRNFLIKKNYTHRKTAVLRKERPLFNNLPILPIETSLEPTEKLKNASSVQIDPNKETVPNKTVHVVVNENTSNKVIHSNHVVDKPDLTYEQYFPEQKKDKKTRLKKSNNTLFFLAAVLSISLGLVIAFLFIDYGSGIIYALLFYGILIYLPSLVISSIQLLLINKSLKQDELNEVNRMLLEDNKLYFFLSYFTFGISIVVGAISVW